MKKNGSAVGTYTYDSTGMRIQKTAGGVTTTYHVMNGVCYGETRSDGRNLQYVFDENGRVIGFRVQRNGGSNRYYFVFNAQGDVVQLLHANGNVVANYTYDTWGRCTVTSGTGGTLSATDIGNINPFRYRGYYYDTETGLYYLQSRYYDPVIGRFVNADGQIAGVGGSMQSYNMFAYCNNNPVNMVDPDGNWPKLSTVFTVVAVAAVIVAAVALTVTTCGVAAPALAVAGGGAIGGLSSVGAVATGALITAGISATAAVITATVENTSYHGPTRSQSVYVMRDKTTGDVQYVGRTNNPIRRQSEHAKDPKKANLQPMEVKFSGLTMVEARAMEQALISAYSLDNLMNARREIATGNVSGFSGKIGNIINIFGGLIEDELLNLMGR